MKLPVSCTTVLGLCNPSPPQDIVCDRSVILLMAAVTANDWGLVTVKPDLIVTEMSVLSSNSSRNQNDCDLTMATLKMTRQLFCKL